MAVREIEAEQPVLAVCGPTTGTTDTAAREVTSNLICGPQPPQPSGRAFSDGFDEGFS